LTFQNLTKTPLIYSVSYFNFGVLGTLFWGQSPHGDDTGLDDLFVAQDIFNNAGNMLRWWYLSLSNCRSTL